MVVFCSVGARRDARARPPNVRFTEITTYGNSAPKSGVKGAPKGDSVEPERPGRAFEAHRGMSRGCKITPNPAPVVRWTPFCVKLRYIEQKSVVFIRPAPELSKDNLGALEPKTVVSPYKNFWRPAERAP